MKKIVSLFLLAAIVFALAACGSSEPDPNAGVYEAKTADMDGISISLDNVFPEGLSIELKNGGKATFRFEGKDYGMKWTLDGTTFHAEGGGAELDGTLSDGVMRLENILDSGINIDLIRSN